MLNLCRGDILVQLCNPESRGSSQLVMDQPSKQAGPGNASDTLDYHKQDTFQYPDLEKKFDYWVIRPYIRGKKYRGDCIRSNPDQDFRAVRSGWSSPGVMAPFFVGSTLAPAASPTVTAGLTWQPDTWPTHCAKLATVTPKHKAILHNTQLQF